MRAFLALAAAASLISGPTAHPLANRHHTTKHFAPSTPRARIDRPPGAYILVDNDTGNVLQSNNEHSRLPPASTTKLLTALVAISHLPPDTTVTVSADAENVPALKIGLKAGERWPLKDLLQASLLVSANDAALALADATSGNVQAFANTRAQAAQTLGLSDEPVFNNPAGLDDNTYAADGSDLVSAHDLAIIGRAALASNVIRPIVAEKRYDFEAPDGTHHHMLNHNQLMNTYAGAIGVKTGYTKKAKHTLVAAATRDGRTMLAVVLDADDPDATASRLMDQGFGTPVEQEANAEHLTLTQLPAYEPVAKSAPVPLTIKHATSGTPFVVLVGTLGIFLLAAPLLTRTAFRHIMN